MSECRLHVNHYQVGYTCLQGSTAQLHELLDWIFIAV